MFVAAAEDTMARFELMRRRQDEVGARVRKMGRKAERKDYLVCPNLWRSARTRNDLTVEGREDLSCGGVLAPATGAEAVSE